ncbi:hypothetical protein ACWGJP_10365 [Microbacterium sp. NPDC055903]
MDVLDTLVWLVNFPVTHGFAMVFIGGFSLLGVGALAFSGVGASSRLGMVREREGLPESDAGHRRRTIVARIRRGAFRVLGAIMLAGLVLGILGLTGVPVTSAYIHANGQSTIGTMDGDWVTFTTSTGETYTLENNFFTPSLHPDRDAWIPSDSEFVVRYLPDHPQAYVIDTTQLGER